MRLRHGSVAKKAITWLGLSFTKGFQGRGCGDTEGRLGLWKGRLHNSLVVERWVSTTVAGHLELFHHSAVDVCSLTKLTSLVLGRVKDARLSSNNQDKTEACDI